MIQHGPRPPRKAARGHAYHAPKPGATIVMRKRAKFMYDVFRRGPNKEGERLVCVCIAHMDGKWYPHKEGPKPFALMPITKYGFTLKSFRAWAKAKYHCI
jgi:hypothetical protein